MHYKALLDGHWVTGAIAPPLNDRTLRYIGGLGVKEGALQGRGFTGVVQEVELNTRRTHCTPPSLPLATQRNRRCCCCCCYVGPRHAVGVPKHVRAWRRDAYLKLGGHTR
jgi:hypothetical protein